MDDTRLRRAKAYADDARCLLNEIEDELVALPASHFISQAHAHLNAAIANLDKAYRPQPEGTDAA